VSTAKKAVNKPKKNNMNYTQQAVELAKKMNLKLYVEGVNYGKHFPEDKQDRYIFTMKLQRGKKSYTFKYGQSIAAGGEEPTMYDVLACFQKYDVGSFEEFCSDFGYSTDSITAHKTYKAVCKEYAAIQRLFTVEELEQLQEIS
jgi:hypothetical protein